MISSLALGAKKVIEAAWLHGDAYDLASQAAFALESAQLLQSPETAAELKRLRARVTELEAQREADHKTWQHDLKAARSEREATAIRIAELEAERHVTNEALDDAVKVLRAGQDRTAPADGITQRIAPTQALRNDDPCGLHHDYRLSRDLPEAGAQ